MSQVEMRVADAVRESGMTITAICAKTGIPYGCLYPSLKGRRELRVSEFLSLCRVLRIDPHFVEEVTE